MKIKELIVIAGPAASGKTHLLSQLRNHACPRLSAQLGIQNLADWGFSNVRDMVNRPAQFEKVLVHCDLHNDNILERVESLIISAEQTQTVSLCAPQNVLLERNSKRIRTNYHWKKFSVSQAKSQYRKLRSLLRRQKKNRNGQTLRTIYTDWFDLLTKHNVESYWINSDYDEDPEVHEVVAGDYSPVMRCLFKS